MSGTAQNAYFRNIPPKTSGTHIVQSNPVDAAAEAFDWVTPLGTAAPQGTCWLTLEALAQDIYVRFGATSTTGTTSSNGRLIKAGSPGVSFFVSPTKDKFIDHIAAAAGGTLKIQVSSPIAERESI
jgi:hypothetical protein